MQGQETHTICYSSREKAKKLTSFLQREPYVAHDPESSLLKSCWSLVGAGKKFKEYKS